MGDPLYHDEDQQQRMASDQQIMAKVTHLQWAKLASGAAALALIGAIWLVWRLG